MAGAHCLILIFFIYYQDETVGRVLILLNTLLGVKWAVGRVLILVASSGTQTVSDITTATLPGSHCTSDVMSPETEESAKEAQREEGEIIDGPSEESDDDSTSSREVRHGESAVEPELED